MNYPQFWTQASSRRKRIYSIAFMFVIAVLVTVAGTFVQLSPADAQAIDKQLNDTRNSPNLPSAIFINNFGICLLMFVPIIGTAAGLFIMFSTGVAIGAEASVMGFPTLLVFVALFLTPIFWLEFISYSIGLTQSVWLFRRLWQRRWRELKWTGIFIGICAGLLAIGAVVEAWLISIGG
jgi:hypothetical protein